MSLVSSRSGRISKDELLSWAKARGLKISQVLKAVDELCSKRLIVRRAVEDKLYYEVRR